MIGKTSFSPLERGRFVLCIFFYPFYFDWKKPLLPTTHKQKDSKTQQDGTDRMPERLQTSKKKVFLNESTQQKLVLAL